MAIDVVPLTPNIGAEIMGLDLSRDLDDETVQAIRNAWLEYVVVLFRDQHLHKNDQIRFTARFGDVGQLARNVGRHRALRATHVHEERIGRRVGQL